MIVPVFRSRSVVTPQPPCMLSKDHPLIEIWRYVMTASSQRHSVALLRASFTLFGYQYFFPCITNVTEGPQQEIVVRLKKYYTNRGYDFRDGPPYQAAITELLGTLNQMLALARESTPDKKYMFVSQTSIGSENMTSHRHVLNSLQLVQLFSSFLYLLNDFQNHLNALNPYSSPPVPDPANYPLMVETFQNGIPELREIFVRLQAPAQIRLTAPSLLSLAASTILQAKKGSEETERALKRPLTATCVTRMLLMNPGLSSELSNQLEVSLEPPVSGRDHQLAFLGPRDKDYLPELNLLSLASCIQEAKNKLDDIITSGLLEKGVAVDCEEEAAPSDGKRQRID